MNTSTRLRQLADRMGLDGFAEELREIAGELDAKAAPAITLEKLDALIHAYSDWQGYIEHGSGDYYNQIEEQKHNTYLRLRAELLDAATQAAPAVPQGEPIAWTVAGEVTNWSRDFSMYRTQHYVRPVYATPAAPSQPAVSQGEQIVGYRISHPSEPDLGTWLAEEAPNDQTDLLIEPLVLAATQSQQVTVTQCDLAKLRDTIVVLMLIAKSVGVLDDISSASEFLADEAARLKKQPKGRTGNDLVAWTIDYLREKEGKR